MSPIIYTDAYKTNHHLMMPKGTSMLYSNGTPRKSRISSIDHVVFFGLQHFIKKYLLGKFKVNFFDKTWDEIDAEYREFIPVKTDHIKALHELGYLPIEIKALPEGALCPIRVPVFTIKNTHPDFYWLTNYLETLISCQMWQAMTSATIAHEYRKLLDEWAIRTNGSVEGVQWQGHDFAMRGMSSIESAILSGMGHLLSFTGTDTIPAIYALKSSYNASGLIGASVPATEHSVMCMGTKEAEIETFERLLDLYPTGILSVVSDSWDLWKVCTEFLPKLRDKILKRDGKLVIRPDSGDPADIICGHAIAKGDIRTFEEYNRHFKDEFRRTAKSEPEFKGVIELLWNVFGGTVNQQGYKVLNPCIGAIYGDSITLAVAQDICQRLAAKGFASVNVVLGIGSYTYQMNTRDTFGFAIKATAGIVNGELREIFKDPITDDGVKKSAKGLLRVAWEKNDFVLYDQQTWEEECKGELRTVFIDGRLVREHTLEEIRERLSRSRKNLEMKELVQQV